MLVASLPFLFIPPLVLILPPLIWGWLTYRSSAMTCWPSTHPLKNASRCAVSIAGRCWALACCGYLAQRRPDLRIFNAAALFLAPFLIPGLGLALHLGVLLCHGWRFAHYTLAALPPLSAGTAELVIE